MNGRTVGLEIVYPGNLPMTQAQYKSAVLFGRVVADLFANGNPEYIRGHAETNGYTGDGKWDPGKAPGVTIDLAQYRWDIDNQPLTEEFLMGLTPNQQQQMYDETAKPYVQTGTSQGQVIANIQQFLDDVQEYSGIPAAELLHQVYGVLADNYVQSGESIGRSVSDIEKKTDKLQKAVDDLTALIKSLHPQT